MSHSSTTSRTLRPVPMAVVASCTATAVATPVLAVMTVDTRQAVVSGPAAVLITSVLLLTWSAVGALVASRLPRNPLGWLLLGVGVLFTAGPFCELYASATRGGSMLPGRRYAAWLSNILLQNPAVFGVIALLLLLFPTGKALGPTWRRFVVGLVYGVVVYTLILMFKPGPMAESQPPTDNPFGVPALDPVWTVTDLVLGPFFMVAIVAGLVCVVLRYRRTSGIERQQMKWLGAGSGGLAVVILSGPTIFWPNERLEAWWTLVFIGGLTLLPLTSGVAILRFRLFEIDRIVSRTVSYLIVVALLVGIYAGSVLALSTAARTLTGESGDLVVALSTLLVAALFHPIRSRVRTRVERRFNRRRYDAQRTLESFGHSLRDQLDSSTLAASLRDAARTSLQPSMVSVYLAGEARAQ